MTPDDTYFAGSEFAPPRHLQRAGQWDAALRLVPDGPTGAALRAEILVDRHQWRLDPADEALAAVEALPASRSELRTFLAAALEYWRRLFEREGAPIGGDPTEAFASLAGHAPIAGWATFWHAVALDNLRHDTTGATDGYLRALSLARAAGDLLLESYALRHLGGHALEASETDRGLALLRRSLSLRAARGARPQVAAAQVALADALDPGPEADELRAIATVTARELELTWLLPAS